MKAQGIIKLVFLLSAILSSSVTLSQPLQFTEEKIEIKIYDGY